jgi:ribosomal RNA-processing protein 1
VLKLWKGLFFALWMCDRAIPQQNLCQELADLLFLLPRESVTPWLRGFWATMAREWTGIDVLRMEKFLLLVRRVLGASFRWMRKDYGGGSESSKTKKKESQLSNWDMSKVDEVMVLLGEWPLSLEEEAEIDQIPVDGDESSKKVLSQKIPVGMRIHVLDIWVDEAEKVGLLADDDEDARQIVQRITDQIDALEEATRSPAVRVRSKDSLADDRLPANKKSTEGTRDGNGDGGPGEEDSEDWGGFDD